MPTSNQKVVGQLNSIRTSLINTIIALRVREDEERAAGRSVQADQLALRRLELNDLSIILWQAEAEARTGGSLAPQISALQGIAADARKASKQIETVTKALAAATKLVNLLAKISILIA